VKANSTDGRRQRQHRIDFLQHVRNIALEPLAQFDDQPSAHFDYIVFLNDVFFCAKVSARDQ
jgi:hypothetical protein